MLKFTEPRIIEREPWMVVGAYCTYEGDDEGPGWSGADSAFWPRLSKITNRKGSLALGFLYRPHKDHPELPDTVRSCFVGVEVTDFDQVPAGLSTTQFSGGKYVLVDCIGDTPMEAAIGVGEAIGNLMGWIPEHGYSEGDACFAAGDTTAPKPPHVETVYIKLEPR
jgi:hypothetical protein